LATPEEHLAKAEQFLATARAARTAGDYDSCVSRSAYAVHHACVALLLANGSPESIARASKPRIQNEFSSLARRRFSQLPRLPGVARSGSLQNSLSVLTTLRNVADYRVPGVTQTDTAFALQFAERILDEVRSII
jgi:hypothetical protein